MQRTRPFVWSSFALWGLCVAALVFVWWEDANHWGFRDDTSAGLAGLA